MPDTQHLTPSTFNPPRDSKVRQCGSLRLSRRLKARRMNPAAARTATAAKVGIQWIRKLMLCVLLLCFKDDPESNEKQGARRRGPGPNGRGCLVFHYSRDHP